MSLRPGGEVGSIGPGVVGHGVRQVVAQILKWALAGDDGLHEEAEHREHGQAPVLQLLHLQLREGVRVVSQPQWVEWASRVDGIHHITKWASSYTVTLHSSHKDHLASPDSENALGVDQRWVSQVVQSAVREDLGSGLEPHWLSEWNSVLGQ